MTSILLRSVWRIEARQTPFHPWIVVEQHNQIERAAQRAPEIKRNGRFYSVRVRAN